MRGRISLTALVLFHSLPICTSYILKYFFLSPHTFSYPPSFFLPSPPGTTINSVRTHIVDEPTSLTIKSEYYLLVTRFLFIYSTENRSRNSGGHRWKVQIGEEEEVERENERKKKEAGKWRRERERERERETWFQLHKVKGRARRIHRGAIGSDRRLLLLRGSD